MLKRPLAALAALVLTVGLAGCSDDEPDSAVDDGSGTSSGSSFELPDNPDGEPCVYNAEGGAAREVELPPDNAAYSEQVDVTVATSAGDLLLTLDPTNAPCTVSSFMSLASQGYFDDTSCHRLTGGGLSVLQCGDPTGTGSGGPGYSYEDELTGGESYPAGTLAMANAGPNTNGSQFFMVYTDSQLPPSYTVFGTIDAGGLAVLEEVAAAGSDEANGPGDGKPNTPVGITGVIPD